MRERTWKVCTKCKLEFFVRNVDRDICEDCRRTEYRKRSYKRAAGTMK